MLAIVPTLVQVVLETLAEGPPVVMPAAMRGMRRLRVKTPAMMLTRKPRCWRSWRATSE